MSFICLITAHPKEDAFGCRLVAAYEAGAAAAGHQLTEVNIFQLRLDPHAGIYVPHGSPEQEAELKRVANLIRHCQHLIIFVPVHRSYLPAMAQSFFQRLFATDVFGRPAPGLWGELSYLHLKTARIISTLDAEAWHSFQRDRSARFHPLKKSVLELLGFRKVRTTTIPPAYDLRNDNSYVQRWTGKIRQLGEKGF